jgi:hypothetical protein
VWKYGTCCIALADSGALRGAAGRNFRIQRRRCGRIIGALGDQHESDALRTHRGRPVTANYAIRLY